MTPLPHMHPVEKAALLRRARDLIASGRSFVSVGKELGVTYQSLQNRAAKEEWYVPKAFEKLNPAPTFAKVEKARLTGVPLPPIGDSLALAQNLLARALVVQESGPMDDQQSRWMILNLPGVIRVLAQAKPTDTGVDHADMKREYESRLRAIEAQTLPVLTAHDEGEIPAPSREDAA